MWKLISGRRNGFFVAHMSFIKITSNHLHHLNKGLDVYLKHYNNLLILGGFNSEYKTAVFSNFDNAKGLSKKTTCFKNENSPSCIDLFLTNRPRYFQNTSTIQTEISDFHKLLVTVLKIFCKRWKRKIIQYRNYETFNVQLF